MTLNSNNKKIVIWECFSSRRASYDGSEIVKYVEF